MAALPHRLPLRREIKTLPRGIHSPAPRDSKARDSANKMLHLSATSSLRSRKKSLRILALESQRSSLNMSTMKLVMYASAFQSNWHSSQSTTLSITSRQKTSWFGSMTWLSIEIVRVQSQSLKKGPFKAQPAPTMITWMIRWKRTISPPLKTSTIHC